MDPAVTDSFPFVARPLHDEKNETDSVLRLSLNVKGNVAYPNASLASFRGIDQHPGAVLLVSATSNLRRHKSDGEGIHTTRLREFNQKLRSTKVVLPGSPVKEDSCRIAEQGRRVRTELGWTKPKTNPRNPTGPDDFAISYGFPRN
ncbi:hypothetical protein KM043_006504 [Ampulex compressa]|nr:hypothetical protein KM043_006504 [Ampulex compressa]